MLTVNVAQEKITNKERAQYYVGYVKSIKFR